MYSAITDYIFFEKLPFFGLTSYTRKVLLLNTSLKYLVYIPAPYRISLQKRGCFEGVKCEGSSFPSSGIWNIQIIQMPFVYIVGIYWINKLTVTKLNVYVQTAERSTKIWKPKGISALPYPPLPIPISIPSMTNT